MRAGVIVMIVLLCLTPVFRNMPQNAQGAVIIAAVVGLFNYEEWWFLLRVSPQLLPFLWPFSLRKSSAIGLTRLENQVDNLILRDLHGQLCSLSRAIDIIVKLACASWSGPSLAATSKRKAGWAFHA